MRTRKLCENLHEMREKLSNIKPPPSSSAEEMILGFCLILSYCFHYTYTTVIAFCDS